ncbi:MAG TPA: STAS domain-containing protein [Acidimicrobiales bacterium]|nr:STAS domain-containing protein [Acidimicrobiales bacterium]
MSPDIESADAPLTALPADFSLTFSRNAGSVVVRVAGELDSYTAAMMRERLADVIDGQGNLSIVVDLEEVSFLDSTGLSTVVRAYQRLRMRGGSLTVARPSPAARKIMEMTGLDRLLTGH